MRAVLGFLARVLVIFVLLEGAASLFVVAWRSVRLWQPPLAEHRHTGYDAELGWASLPQVDLPDLYGPGVSLRTNSLGFRGRRELAPEPPPGRVRVICSGDSFTLGYGVGDDETWCAGLELRERRFEAVNLGQGGYGIDQSYLWFRRHAEQLGGGVHVLAFITEDFARMRSATFLGYAKPVLRVRADALVVENVPVPRASLLLPRLTQNLRLLDELRSVTLLGAALRRLDAPATSLRDDELPRLALRLFEELRSLGRAEGGTLVLVYLPVEEDRAPGRADAWRLDLARMLAAGGFDFIDLVPAFRELSPVEHERMFIPAGRLAYAFAGGHYTAAGNALVAELLAPRLAALPAVSECLRAASGASAQPHPAAASTPRSEAW